MDYNYESSVIIGIITKHCIQELSHNELDNFFDDIAAPISSVCVKSIDLFASSHMNQNRIDVFNEYKDVADVLLTLLIQRDIDEYLLFTFLIHTYDDGDDTEFNMELISTEMFNIPIAENLYNLISNRCLTKDIHDFVKRSMKSRGYNRMFIRDTYAVDFSHLDSIDSSSLWIEEFCKTKSNMKSNRFKD